MADCETKKLEAEWAITKKSHEKVCLRGGLGPTSRPRLYRPGHINCGMSIHTFG